MKIIFLMTLLLTLSNIDHLFAQSAPKFKQLGVQKNNWTTKDLIEPAALASILKNPKASQPLIFNIGMVDDIKGAQKVGASSEKDGLTKFKAALSKLSKNRSIVVYCGCCPFERCPNIRPAIKALKDGGFTNARLLNLPTNVKSDWINKGYPLGG